MGVAGEIGQDRLGSGERALGEDDPLAATQRGQACDEGGAVGQARKVAEEAEAAFQVGVGELVQEQPPEQA